MVGRDNGPSGKGLVRLHAYQLSRTHSCLSDFVARELMRVRLVDQPPEVAVAAQASSESRLRQVNCELPARPLGESRFLRVPGQCRSGTSNSRTMPGIPEAPIGGAPAVRVNRGLALGPTEAGDAEGLLPTGRQKPHGK